MISVSRARTSLQNLARGSFTPVRGSVSKLCSRNAERHIPSPVCRQIHSFPSSKVYQPLPYSNMPRMLDYYIPKCDTKRALGLHIPKAALEEDIRQLFEESGYHPETIIMLFNGCTGNNLGKAFAIMPDAQQAHAAVENLDKAPLFGERLLVNIYKSPGSKLRFKDYTWGWYATCDDRMKNLRHRAPKFTRLHDVSTDEISSGA